MLAEPKRKQKISVDPRGLNWSNDESKFGQKMLEKMGWSKGKGLGAKEDGKTEHISNGQNKDKRGLGCSQSNADNWIAHQDDFNALLSQLHSTDSNTTESDPKQLQNLEEKSKSSKGRVHYKKFTKGKDLSAARKEDLDCIFGSRKTKSAPVSPQHDTDSEPEAEEEKLSDAVESGSLKTITSSTNIADYFAKKMAELKKSSSSDRKLLKDGSISEEESYRPSFAVSSLQEDQDETNQNVATIKRKSKKKRKITEVLNETSAKDDINCEINDSSPVAKKKKKKKKKNKEKHESEKEAEDHGAYETVTDSSIPEEDSITEPLSSGKAASCSFNDEVTEEQQTNGEVNSGAKVKRKKKKKKKVDATPEREVSGFIGSNYSQITGYAGGISLKKS